MSSGQCCRCPESKKPIRDRNWVVTRRYCNYSAFNGYHYTPSDYSTVRCQADGCLGLWRTKAQFVGLLRDA